MMRSATAFLPPSMITFMNLDSSTLPNLGSGRISRLGTSRRRGIFYLYLASVGIYSDTARSIQDSHLLDPRRTAAFGVTTLHTAPRGEQHRMIPMKNPGLTWPWASWHRTWSGTACGLSRLAGPANHGRC